MPPPWVTSAFGAPIGVVVPPVVVSMLVAKSACAPPVMVNPSMALARVLLPVPDCSTVTTAESGTVSGPGRFGRPATRCYPGRTARRVGVEAETVEARARTKVPLGWKPPGPTPWSTICRGRTRFS